VKKGEIRNYESMTKKGHQKFWWMKHECFSESSVGDK